MKHSRTRSFAILAVLLSSPATALVQETEASATPGTQDPIAYGRAAREGVPVFNMADPKGLRIAELEAGSLVAVFREHAAGWREVEVPGGFAVWVWGQFLRPSSEEGIWEVTGNAVNVRPEPSNDVRSFPLPQRLQAGDRVAVIGPLDPDVPREETWIRIWSPPGVRGFVRASDLEPLETEADGAALWSQALTSVRREAPEAVARERVAREGRQAEDPARAALERAREEIRAQSERETPDYGEARRLLEGVVAMGGGAAVEARVELERVASLEEIARLRDELKSEERRRAEAARAAQERVWARSHALDPLRGVFDARGLVERRVGSDGSRRYFLRFGGETRAELLSTTGRYDLELLVGYLIGLRGRTLGELEPGVVRYDLQRVEILERKL